MRVLIVRLVIATSVCSAACDSQSQQTKHKPTAADVTGPFEDAKPSELVYMYRSNSVAADREYKGRALRIRGIIDRVGQDADGIPLVVMRDDPSDDTNRLLTIRCAWGGDMNKVAHLEAGQRFIAQGVGAGLFAGEPLVVLCDGERPPPEEVSVQTPKQDPGYWKHNLRGFIEGKDVKKYKLTWNAEETQFRIETDKCDRAKLGVEQLGSMPEDFTIECVASGKGSAAVQWHLPEAAGSQSPGAGSGGAKSAVPTSTGSGA